MSGKLIFYGVDEAEVQGIKDFVGEKAKHVAFEEDEFEKVDHRLMVKYGVGEFLDSAEKYSNMQPPDVVQFSEKIWAAASMSVIEFVVKHFRICIKSHTAKTLLLEEIASACKGVEVFVYKTFTKAEKYHSNFYMMDMRSKADRADIMRDVRIMVGHIKNANIKMVDERIKENKSFRLTMVPSKNYIIGTVKYTYDQEIRA